MVQCYPVMLIWTVRVFGPFQKVLGHSAFQDKVHKPPCESIVGCAKVYLHILGGITLLHAPPLEAHMGSCDFLMLKLCPVPHVRRLLDPWGHVPVFPLFALHVAHQLKVALHREVLSA